MHQVVAIHEAHARTHAHYLTPDPRRTMGPLASSDASNFFWPCSRQVSMSPQAGLFAACASPANLPASSLSTGAVATNYSCYILCVCVCVCVCVCIHTHACL